VPFLDHDLVELATRLRAVDRSLPGLSKVLLRRLAFRLGVPWQTIVHRKIGFQIPIGGWFRNELRPAWAEILDARAVPGVDYDEVRRLVDAHLAGRGQYGEILWRVMALEMWHAHWIRGGSLAVADPGPSAARSAASPVAAIA
jgi:asparagine synthase (glutamine-hydrolysing)